MKKSDLLAESVLIWMIIMIFFKPGPKSCQLLCYIGFML